jgi:hypothetical protein
MVASLLLFAVGQVSAPPVFTAPNRPGISGFDARHDFILTNKEAIGMLAPQIASPATAERIEWSSDGDYLLVQSTDAKSVEDVVRGIFEGQTVTPPARDAFRRQLTIYSVRGQKTQAVIPIDPTAQVSELNWLHGDDQVVAQYDEETRSADGAVTGSSNAAVMISPNGHVRELIRVTDEHSLRVHVSPTRPVVVLEDIPWRIGKHRLVIVPSNGAPTTEVELPDGYDQLDWGADGTAYIQTFTPVKNAPPIQHWYTLDLATAKLTQDETAAKKLRAASPKTPPPPDFFLDRLIYRIPRGDATSEVARGFVLKTPNKTEAPEAIVTPDGETAALSPTRDAVAYISQGVALVRSFLHMPKDRFIAMRNAAIRTALMNQAKQVALGLLMNANDYDDNYVSNATDWKSALEPYLKDPTLTDGFMYTYPGGNMAAIENPATTMLGYIDGPGGRAVAYADGHCRWLSN